MNRNNNIHKTSECCSVEMLTDYLNGNFNAAQTRIIEEHLIDCECCSDLVEGLSLLEKPQDINKISKEINRKVDSYFLKKTTYKQISKTKYRAIAASLLLIIMFGTALLVNTFTDFGEKSKEKDIAQLNQDEEAEIQTAEDEHSTEDKLEMTEPSLDNKTLPSPVMDITVEETTVTDKISQQKRAQTGTGSEKDYDALIFEDTDLISENYNKVEREPEEIIAELKTYPEVQDEAGLADDLFSERRDMNTSVEGKRNRRNVSSKSESTNTGYSALQGAGTATQSDSSLDKSSTIEEHFEELAIVDDDLEVDTRMDVDSEAGEDSKTTYSIPTFALEEEQDETDPIDFAVVEEKPEFPGGDTALINFIAKNTEYPQTAKDEGIQGRVIVHFVISETGDVTNIRIARGVNPYLDQEALRVVRLMPRWKPGKQRGKNVPIKYMIPINFYLSKE
jgi:TonB family protein